ncbi:hypothetical protein AB0M43_21960 [Longispora sp. NPDC051575]|uniref:hypothetical protein n=1 Tax=Longispora sp. NPDC051575 TaxID=3154943 RepID=UPI0034466D5F
MRALLRAVLGAVLAAGALSGAVAGAPGAASADPGWGLPPIDNCRLTDWTLVPQLSFEVFRAKGNTQTTVALDTPVTYTQQDSFTEEVSEEVTYSGGVGLEFAILKLKGDYGNKFTQKMTFSGQMSRQYMVPAGKTLDVAYGFFNYHATYTRQWQPAGCANGTVLGALNALTYWIEAPKSHGYNARYHGSGPQWRPGPPGGGSVTPPKPPTPQPVTSVYGLADGTVLHTTDTRRIYKMVGGAPVWQATCDGGICLPESRPTKQAVVDAGPAVPRDGSSAVDQRGRVYLFVGGAPLWQSSCAAPINCGTPPKVSDWSIDGRDHMNAVPVDGHLIQGFDGGVGTQVAMTVGGARIHFATPQEVIDTGHGTDWAATVTKVSTWSFNGLGELPADGTLVQGLGGDGPTPVAMFAAGARINFANPQEVIDAGYGADWSSKIRPIPTRAFNALRANIPPDGTLVQGLGAGGPTPVAMMVGGARVNFANPQEVIDSGFGADWSSKIHPIPSRAFTMIPDVPGDGTLLRGAGGSSVAVMAGGARVRFDSPQEVVDTGHGTDWAARVRVIPSRAYEQLPARIGDRTVFRAPDARPADGIDPASVFLVVGGARVPIASEREFLALGYTWGQVVRIPVRVALTVPTRIRSGTPVQASEAAPGIDPRSVFVVAGGARVPMDTEAEFLGLGHTWPDVVRVPPRVVGGLSTLPANGTVVRAPNARAEDGVNPNSVFLVAGGSRIPIASEQEFLSLGYAWTDVVSLPVRVVRGLSATLRDRVLIQGWSNGAATTGVAEMSGGKRFVFGGADEVVSSGYGDNWSALVTRVPTRVFDALPASRGTEGFGWAAGGTLPAGQVLTAGMEVRTPNRQYQLLMRADGNLVEYAAGGRELWSTGTAGNPGAKAVLQRDGNLVVYSAAGAVLWHSGTGGHADGEYVLALQGDANLVVYAPGGGSALWANGTRNDTLPAGSVLESGWSLCAAHNRGCLYLLGDGNLVRFGPDGTAQWDSRTPGNPGAKLVVQYDGNLVLYSATGAVLWNSGTGGQPTGGHALTVRDRGELVLTDPSNTVRWASDRLGAELFAGQVLRPNWTMRSPDGRYRLAMRSDGNLVEYGPDDQPVWSSQTTNHPGSRLVMQYDGNLVMYGPYGDPVWDTATGGHPQAAHLVAVQNDGNVVVYAADGTPLWDRHRTTG